MTRGARIAIVAVLQTLALCVMIGMKQYTLATGSAVLLKTEPIDPRSLFSGDYVRLNYAISRLDLNALEGDDEFARGDTVYVVLREGAEYWEAFSVHREYPPVGPGRRAIKGRAQFVAAPRAGATSRHLGVKYGIENYFVPEGEGRDLERPKPGETVSIRVVVDARGNAAIQAVLVNGAERYVERLL